MKKRNALPEGEFEEYDRCVIDCHNNGPVEETVADLVNLFENVAELARR
jgi:predicted neutral ceramidase superfamily lipid hydrolase